MRPATRVPLDAADAVGGAGRQRLQPDLGIRALDQSHGRLPTVRICSSPLLPMNREFRNGANLLGRIAKARTVNIAPLRMEAVTQNGEEHTFCAINEVSSAA